MTAVFSVSPERVGPHLLDGVHQLLDGCLEERARRPPLRKKAGPPDSSMALQLEQELQLSGSDAALVWMHDAGPSPGQVWAMAAAAPGA